MTNPLISFFASNLAGPIASPSVDSGRSPSAVQSGVTTEQSAVSFFDLLMMAGLQGNQTGGQLADSGETVTTELFANTMATLDAPHTDKPAGEVSLSLPTDQNGLLALFGLPLNPALMQVQLADMSTPSIVLAVTSTSHNSASLLKGSKPDQDVSALENLSTGLQANDFNSDPFAGFMNGNPATVLRTQPDGKSIDLGLNSKSDLTTQASNYDLTIDPALARLAGSNDSQSIQPWAKSTESMLGAHRASKVALTLSDLSEHVGEKNQNATDKQSAGALLSLPVNLTPKMQALINAKHFESKESNTIASPQVGVTKQLVGTGSTPSEFNFLSPDENSADNAKQFDSNESAAQESSANDAEVLLGSHSRLDAQSLNVTAADSSAVMQALSEKSSDMKPQASNSSDFTSDETKGVQFVIPDLNLASAKSGARIVIEMEPRTLGQAELRLSVQHEIVRAELRVDSIEAKQTVEANLDQLHRSLEKAGITVGKIDVSVSDRQPSQHFHQQQNGHRPPTFFTGRRALSIDDTMTAGVLTGLPLIHSSTVIRPGAGRSWTA